MASGGDPLPARLTERHRHSVEGAAQNPENAVETSFLRILRLSVALHGSAEDQVPVREVVDPREARVREVCRELLERLGPELVGPDIAGQRIEKDDSLTVGGPIGSQAEVGELDDLGRQSIER
jgi:hypothetical protein